SWIVPASGAFSDFTDVKGHWAEQYIKRVVEKGLFSGVTKTTFDPNGTMSRAMFVTVLCRLDGIQPNDWKLSWSRKLFSDLRAGSYYEPYVCWAALHGIARGTGLNTFAPGSAVTREQLATFLAKYLQKEDCALKTVGQYEVNYSDKDKVSAWAWDSVAYLTSAGILNGKSDGHGGTAFYPKQTATRAECAAVFCRVLDSIRRPQSYRQPESIALLCLVLTLKQGESFRMYARILPEEATNRTVVWYSEDSRIVTADLDGNLTGKAGGVAKIYGVSSNRLTAVCTVTVETDTPGPGLANGDMSYSEKLMMVYGTTNVADPRLVYTSESESLSHQTSISVKTWDLDANGKKVTKNWSLTVHEKLASTVLAVFNEIYALPEKPPIHALGGWRWRANEKSEHNMGLAVDINPNENPYVPKGYDAYAMGFKPGEDPYSIPIGGKIDQIFAKYGFTRGIYWNNGNKDYMHYSFFGT
ncbi:MAG: S-layer homology domain-containing protein, partial [Oscillospiraceae bacterium]|nr:S-layer homology domain-containing protein [Oscillospiraceae bacterium]